VPRFRGRSPRPNRPSCIRKRARLLPNRHTPRPFSLPAASAFPSELTLDALMLDALAAAFAAIAAAVARAVVAFVASAASASARAADFSLRWRSA